MKQIDEEIYKNWKFLKWNKQYIDKLKDTWDERNDIRRIPSVIIIKWKINSRIDYDINPLWNIKTKNESEIWYKIEELVKKELVIQKEYEMSFWISWYFKISTEKSEETAEEIYDLLLKYIK